MVGRQILLRAVRRVALAGIVENAVAVLEQALLQDVAALRRARRDDELAILVAQHLDGRHAGRDDAQREAWCLRAHNAQQRGQEQVALEQPEPPEPSVSREVARPTV